MITYKDMLLKVWCVPYDCVSSLLFAFHGTCACLSAVRYTPINNISFSTLHVGLFLRCQHKLTEFQYFLDFLYLFVLHYVSNIKIYPDN